jgi:hypothetical protein
VWYRDTYEVEAPIRKIAIARNLKKKTVGEAKAWVEKEIWAEFFDDEDLLPLSAFQKHDSELELEPALIKDLHKLSLLGLLIGKKDTYPAPIGCTCKHCVGQETAI